MRKRPSTLVTTAIALLALAGGCDDASLGPASSAPYLVDADARRDALEAALWQPALPYSASLLNNYGFGDYGWDLLPEMPAASRPFTMADSQDLGAGRALEPGELTDLAPRSAPVTRDDWQRLGERVFYDLPMRYDSYLTWLVSRPETLADYGIVANADGTIRGAVVFADARGDVRVGISCAFCHAEQGISGRGNRQLDLGLARGDYMSWAGQNPDRYYGWGRGRIDVTDDPVDSPTAIPDLWGLADASHLNHSGVIALPADPIAATTTMAVRFETQLILGHRMRSRPSRTLTWALATFVRSLAPPDSGGPYQRAEDADDSAAIEGEAAFAARCATCHDPSRSYGGGLVTASSLPVDPNVALTPERGTGHYKVPSLLGLRGAAPYLHDGSVADLTTLLANGHPFGAALSLADRGARLAVLNTL